MTVLPFLADSLTIIPHSFYFVNTFFESFLSFFQFLFPNPLSDTLKHLSCSSRFISDLYIIRHLSQFVNSFFEKNQIFLIVLYFVKNVLFYTSFLYTSTTNLNKVLFIGYAAENKFKKRAFVDRQKCVFCCEETRKRCVSVGKNAKRCVSAGKND